MHTVDQIAIGAPMDRVFQIASDVERWPEILSHYRWVRVFDRLASGGTLGIAGGPGLQPPPDKLHALRGTPPLPGAAFPRPPPHGRLRPPPHRRTAPAAR